ncbi:16543_t:CDS:1 [Dentiscutata erythropus]|uniref:16543_t:CDS:1 n=1 Tax=Dentiscutata erythropus TaxID=1348616 RepID=A0A9N9IW00_9GLOM|nr:16543_t:CDS:1 [Dentiscutata erythropus]
MIKKFTSLFILFLLIFITVVLVTFEGSLVVRAEKSCNSKRSPLEARHKKCECTVATSVFNDTVNGIIVYYQDVCGDTTAVGLFKSGFKQGHKYDFLITNDCGEILHNMTSELNVMFVNDGTSPFKAKLDGVNLNCDNTGILNAITSKPPSSDSSNSTAPSKRHYYEDPCASKYSKYRKRAQGAETHIYEDGNSYSQALISTI